MGKRYLIDSNTVIDFLGGKLPETGKLFLFKIKPEISVITCIEILSKKDLPVADSQKYRAFMSTSVIYSEINDEITTQTINIRKKYGLKTPDAIIAATAIVYKLTLISRNEKDFQKVHKLDLISPWKL